jgi:rod shape determining protein RodA
MILSSNHQVIQSNYTQTAVSRFLQRMHLDLPLLLALLTLMGTGLFILYSASGQDPGAIYRQSIRLAIALGVMFVMTQITPQALHRWTPRIFIAGVLLLVVVAILGEVGKGAQRWLDLGFVRFQPSELMKLAVPMMVAWHLADVPLPATLKRLLLSTLLVAIPVVLVARQPDLGTSLMIASAGFFVLFLAGLKWRILFGAMVSVALMAYPLWVFYLRDYQRQRILTFLNPENEPLGAGYHIIQSKIAVGSGGVYGKGWLNGTQSQLDFLPERHTDFIFAVFSEEFGLMGAIILLLLYLFVIFRGLYIATQAQDTYSRLLAGSLSLTFFMYLFVNMGMVIGLLPVVGVPLPLVSYGGTSIVTLMAGFGILMSIHTHKRMLAPATF